MSAAIIIDIIFVLIVAVSFIIGLKMGFIKRIMSLLCLVIALVVAWNFMGSLGAYFNDKFFSEKMSDVVYSSLRDFTVSPSGESKIDELVSETPDALKDILKGFGCDEETFAEYCSASAEKKADELTRDVAEKISEPIAKKISNAAAFLVLFAAAYILLTLVLKLIDVIVKLPVLNFANRILGGAFGALTGLLTVWLLSIIIVKSLPYLSSVYPAVFSENLLDKSVILNAMYDFNPLYWIGKFIG